MSSIATFDKLVEGYYRAWWRLCPTAGSKAGLREFDPELETPGREWIDERRRLVRDTATALRALTLAEDGTPESLDRMVFESHLNVADLRLQELQHWRKDPSQPITEAVDAVFELMMRRDLNHRDTAEAILRRLNAIPAYLSACRMRIDDPVGLWTSIAQQSVPGGIEFLRDAALEVGGRHARMRSEVEAAAGASCEALSEYGAWLASLRSGPLNQDVAAGSKALERLIREWHGIGSTLEEIETQGWGLIQYFKDELEQAARNIDNAAGWNEILHRARERFISVDGDILGEYRRTTDELRDRIARDGLLDLPPGETCKVVATPAFLRALLPTAAYTNPGPLDPHQIGIFFVTEPDRRLDAETYRANLAQHYGIEETCVHEAYPGHHVQLCWANRAGSMTRQMADHIIFMEGWTLYCEQWMIEGQWFPDPALKINYLLGQLWRAHRMVIDIGVHTGHMTVAQAVRMLMEGVGFTRERAETELNWYTQSPGVPLSYMVGKRETLALRDAFLGRPGTNLRMFHSWLLRFGSIPQKWLWRYLPQQIQL